MGRAKLEMKLVSKEKRHTTYRKRKEGLLKKIYEFTTLCDVKACMIIFPPRLQASPGSPDQQPPPPEIWPEGSTGHVADLINLYRATNNGGTTTTTRNSGLSEFYLNRIKKTQEELEKTKKKGRELVYPTSTDAMIHLSETELREIANKLENKIVAIKCTIESNKAYSNALALQQRNSELDHQLQYYQQQENNYQQNNNHQNHSNHQNQIFSFMGQLMSKNEDENGVFPANQYSSLKSEFVHAPPPPVGMYGGGSGHPMPNYHADFNGQYLHMGYLQFPPNQIVEQNMQPARGVEFFQ